MDNDNQVTELNIWKNELLKQLQEMTDSFEGLKNQATILRLRKNVLDRVVQHNARSSGLDDFVATHVTPLRVEIKIKQDEINRIEDEEKYEHEKMYLEEIIKEIDITIDRIKN